MEANVVGLDQVDLTQKLSRKAYKKTKKALLQRLYELERECFERGVPVIIVFEGWDAAGKGTSIRELTARLDPRGFKVLATQASRTHEKLKPWLWRFWMDIPRRGQMAIFDRSWYGRVLVERVQSLTSLPDWIRAYEEINGFERTLTDDGTVIIKFWLHISKQEQLRRFARLTGNPETAWQVTAEDWENHRRYDDYMAAVEDMLANTHTEYGPWVVVPATSRHVKSYLLLTTLIARLEAALGFDVTAWPSAEELQAERKQNVKQKAKRAGEKEPSKQDRKDTEAAKSTKLAKRKNAAKAKSSAKSGKSAKDGSRSGAKADPAKKSASDQGESVTEARNHAGEEQTDA